MLFKIKLYIGKFHKMKFLQQLMLIHLYLLSFRIDIPMQTTNLITCWCSLNKLHALHAIQMKEFRQSEVGEQLVIFFAIVNY